MISQLTFRRRYLQDTNHQSEVQNFVPFPLCQITRAQFIVPYALEPIAEVRHFPLPRLAECRAPQRRHMLALLRYINNARCFNTTSTALFSFRSRAHSVQNGCRRCDIPPDSITLLEICRNDGYVVSASASRVVLDLKRWKCYRVPILE